MTPRDAVLGLKTVASLLNRFQTLPVFGGSPTVHKLCGFGVLFQPKPASDSRNAWQCFQHVTGWFRMAWSAKSGYEPEGREFESLRAETLGIEARFRPKGGMLRVDEARDRRCGGFQTQDFSEGAAAGGRRRTGCAGSSPNFRGRGCRPERHGGKRLFGALTRVPFFTPYHCTIF